MQREERRQPRKRTSPPEKLTLPLVERADERRPAGMQAMGPTMYAQLRQALHELGNTPSC